MFNIIVVLYGISYQNSNTVNSLKHLLTKNDYPELGKIILFDNNGRAVEPESLPAQFTYFHSEKNVGLAKAYNFALNQAEKNIDWLITFDQDTIVTAEYLTEMIENQKNKSSEIVLLAPVIFVQNQQISPVSSQSLRPLNQQKIIPNQIYSKNIMVINSGTAVKVSFMNLIEGYNETFPLDYLDHWLSWIVFQKKKQIKIIKSNLQHELSVLDYRQVSLERYKKILRAENVFFLNYKQDLVPEYRRQLFMRAVKHLVNRRFSFAKITFQYFFKFLEGTNGSKGAT